jgi:hypothetical protein
MAAKLAIRTDVAHDRASRQPFLHAIMRSSADSTRGTNKCEDLVVKTIVHCAQDLAALLRLGLSPITDNREALLGLGFEPAYPQIRRGYESTIWERSIEQHRRRDGRLAFARERAYLVDSAALR